MVADVSSQYPSSNLNGLQLGVLEEKMRLRRNQIHMK